MLVLRNGGEVARRTFELHEGESLDVRVAVVLRAAAAVAEDTPAEVVLAPAPAAAGGVDDGVWIGLGVGLGAVVVAGIVIGVVFATTPSAPMPYQGNFGDGIVRF